MRRAVGTYQTVAAEVTVTRHIHAIIASISPIGTASRVRFQNTLVHPVPDVSALQVGILVDFLPLVPQVSVGIAHRMRIFRRNDRTVRTVRTDIGQPFGTGILGHVHVGVPLPLGTFVVHGTVHQIFLPFLYPQISLIEVISVTSFVAQRPEGYGRIVFVALIHILRTVEVGLQPFGVVAQRSPLAQVVEHAVRLDVGLIIYIQAVFIAQFIETAVLRIVSQTNRIDVVAFHQLEVFPHQLLGYVVSRSLVVLMDVHTLEFQRLSIDEQHGIGLSVLGQLVNLLDFDATEPNVEGNDFGHLSVFLDRHQQFV
ncbi:putative uncharacterized protein [Bacteroides sp. CAG:661]|nr:putative uncharacterized protein [Bacteroides sp. CAG:661]